MLAQLLLAHGAKASIVDKVGETVLHAAIRDRVSVSMLSLLLRSGKIRLESRGYHNVLNYSELFHILLYYMTRYTYT